MLGLNDEPVTGTERAYLDFYLGLRIGWAKLHHPLLDLFDARTADWTAAHGREPVETSEIGDVIEDSALFRCFMYLQRHTQLLMKYGPYGTHAYIEARRDELTARMAEAEGPDLDPALPMPAYYADTDYHLEKGGYWQDDLDGPVYDFGTRIHFAGLENVGSIHRAKTEALPRGDYRRVVDLGCGTGDGTFGLAETFPGAEVIGVDLAAPFLKWADLKARDRGLPISFVQKDAADTGIEGGSCQLVTSTMIFHEMPAEQIAAIVRESYRLLEPGGAFAVYTAGELPTTYGLFMMDWHAHINNEPFMSDFFRADLEKPLVDAGYTEVTTTVVDAFRHGDKKAYGSAAPPDPRRARAGGWRLVTGRKPI
ncbi:class I SAM-dependent methyltransferase [Streptomyces sp. NPDC058953]|uniref:class I SAM-dependent methyltransferase n=1 Tax=unclassified Streptomyces TaxID=2593676 RepID=UPI0036C29689